MSDRMSVCPKCKSGDSEEGPLREDWQFYIEGVTLHIEYRCECHECGFVFEIDKKINMISGDKQNLVE